MEGLAAIAIGAGERGGSKSGGIWFDTGAGVDCLVAIRSEHHGGARNRYQNRPENTGSERTTATPSHRAAVRLPAAPRPSAARHLTRVR